MPLWSFPGVVTGMAEPFVAVTADLGSHLYQNLAVKVAGITLKATPHLPSVLPPGTKVLVTGAEVVGAYIRAHITLPDGRDAACVAKGRKSPEVPSATYGGTLGKVWTYPATVERIADGDTFTATIETGVQGLRHRTSIRVAHIDTAEVDTQAGKDARLYAEKALTTGLPITLTSHAVDKYGRLLASVTMPDGRDYGSDLLAVGLAVPYEGGAK